MPVVVVRLRSAVCLLGRFPALAGVDLDVAEGLLETFRSTNLYKGRVDSMASKATTSRLEVLLTTGGGDAVERRNLTTAMSIGSTPNEVSASTVIFSASLSK